MRARKLFAYGELRDYWDHMNCVGCAFSHLPSLLSIYLLGSGRWVRMGEPEKGRPNGCAVVICNGDEGCVVITVRRIS
jgi:alpha-amylase